MSFARPDWTAAVLRVPGASLDLTNIAKPDLVHGQVLVKMQFSGVCRSQLMEARGLRGADKWIPHLLGHEGVGMVVEVGAGVEKVRAGDEVILGWIPGEGIDAQPPTLVSSSGERINAGKVTTFAEYSVVSENRCYLKPADLDSRHAVLFGCAFLTGSGMVVHEAKPKPSDTVLVNGLGGVGLAALVAAKELGCLVVAVDAQEDKRDLASSLGADFVIDPSVVDLVQAVHEITVQGVDVAIDASGTTVGIERAFACTRSVEGRLIFASHPPAGERICLDPFDLIRGRTIRGSWGGSSQPDRDIPMLSAALKKSGTNLDAFLPRAYRLDQINDALDDLENNRAVRPLISFGD